MDWKALVFSALSTVVVALVTWLSQRLIALINTKLANTKLGQCLTDAVNICTSVVKEVYQTYVEPLKKSNAFTADDQKAALKMATDKILEQLTGSLKAYISDNFGDVNKWITTMIESIIYDLKNENSWNSVEIDASAGESK